jgi:organic hydroperoxide reductase OsmC/OhrA
MAHTHTYRTTISWAGETRDYNTYSREYGVAIPGKPKFRASADAAFKGDARLYNPEDMLVVSLATCHMLSYLAVCARLGIIVTGYEDHAEGTVAIKDKRMRFIEVVLHPRVMLASGADMDRAAAAHKQAHEECFISNSVNFPVRHEAITIRNENPEM